MVHIRVLYTTDSISKFSFENSVGVTLNKNLSLSEYFLEVPDSITGLKMLFYSEVEDCNLSISEIKFMNSIDSVILNTSNIVNDIWWEKAKIIDYNDERVKFFFLKTPGGIDPAEGEIINDSKKRIALLGKSDPAFRSTITFSAKVNSWTNVSVSYGDEKSRLFNNTGILIGPSNHYNENEIEILAQDIKYFKISFKSLKKESIYLKEINLENEHHRFSWDVSKINSDFYFSENVNYSYSDEELVFVSKTDPTYLILQNPIVKPETKLNMYLVMFFSIGVLYIFNRRLLASQNFVQITK